MLSDLSLHAAYISYQLANFQSVNREFSSDEERKVLSPCMATKESRSWPFSFTLIE